jgi:hypothetical protein
MKVTTRYWMTRRDGQTLVIALFVLFVMLFLGLVFVGLVARNLFYSQRSTSATGAENFAEAGIRYAHEQLRTSPLGADWRPIPTNLPPDLSADPDYRWLRAPDPGDPTDMGGPDGRGSFTRVNFDKGRALIRVSYEPRPDDPLSRYIKIESVGRFGVMREDDPTLYTQGASSLARTKIAYAAVGVTDYARFITNLDRRGQPAQLGYPTNFGAMFGDGAVNVPMIVGDSDAMAGWPGDQIPYGGPMRVNSGLRLYGDFLILLNRERGDTMEVAGEIEYADPTSAGRVGTHDHPAGWPIFNSTVAQFETYGGLVRDGRRQVDVNGYPRQIEYLDPPLIDEVDQATGQERYVAATRYSGRHIVGYNGRYFDTGRIGYGEGIYIDNNNDIQEEIQEFGGGPSLRSDWLEPNGGSPYWQGPYYIPPGVYIELLPDGFRITRNARDDSQTWRTPTNQRTSRHSLRFFLQKDSNSPTGVTAYNEFTGPNDPQPFNGVIYAEGNIRIRGIIPVDHQLTVVSGATIYVEGSILKGDADSNPATPSFSALSLLARDYVCLNTTQFVGPSIAIPLNFEPDAQDIIAPYHINVEQGSPFNARFAFGVDPADPVNGYGNVLPRLYVRHAAESGGAAYINMLVNYGQNPAASQYMFENAPPNVAGIFYSGESYIPTYGLGDTSTQVFPRYEHRSFPLISLGGETGAYTLLTNGLDNYLTLQSDPQVSYLSSNRPYYLSRLAVQPLDVKIMALMYAQRGAFFVIPGPWFNANPNDRREVYDGVASNPELWRLQNFGAYPEFPFYAEPLDIRITVLGAVAENFPPEMSDQEQWMRHWAWVPKEYGRSGELIPASHVPPGFENLPYVPNLFITYDPTFATATAGGVFTNDRTLDLRQDAYGRLLPATPMLPVSPKLLYFGEVRP